jgi:hypothetical protein
MNLTSTVEPQRSQGGGAATKDVRGQKAEISEIRVLGEGVRVEPHDHSNFARNLI